MTFVQRTWKAIRERPSLAAGKSEVQFMKPPTALVLLAVAQVCDERHHGMVGGVDIQEVAAHTGMARSTAALHLNRLVAWGWLGRREASKYTYILQVHRLPR